MTDEYEGSAFFTVQDGVRMATPLLLVLAVVELSDVVFAVDSIPAVCAPADTGVSQVMHKFLGVVYVHMGLVLLNQI